MNLFIKLIIKPLRSLLKLLFNRIFYVALALVVQLAWLLIALFRLMEYSRWVTIGMQVIGFLVVLWIVNKKINPSYKLAWTMLILIFPVFGVSLYLLFGKSRIGAVMEQHYQNLIDETAEYWREVRCESMSNVIVKENETLDSALRRFKRSCAKAGIQQEIRKREHYEKPSVRRKKKSEAARKRKYN